MFGKIANFVINIIKLYKKITKYMPHRCRFIPSCSFYAMEAVSRYGALRGLFLFTKRFLRCNFLCRGGVDKVP